MINAFEDLIDAKRIVREIRLLRHFNHENVIKIVDILPPPSINARGSPRVQKSNTQKQ